MQSKNKIWFLAGVFCSIIVGFIAYFISHSYYHQSSSSFFANSSNSKVTASSCTFKRVNVLGYKFIKPVLLLETECESADLFPLKNQLTDLITHYQSEGSISNASVCVFDMNRSEWTGVNENSEFQPGSLIKVPLAISVLKILEEKKIKLTDHLTVPTDNLLKIHQTYSANSVVPGKSYTIEELLKYSLAYSDNLATQVLNNFIDIKILKKVFTDVSIAEPNVADPDYTISTKNYSKFIRILYNGTYIHRQHSELVLTLMNQSSFKDGILASIDTSKAIASTKFGESMKGNEHQLHETGVIYVNNSAYIVTIMTAGKDVKKLPEVIKNISKLVYDKMSVDNINNTIAKL
ncbi:MAG: hypothetical protein RJA07_1377 [Bacteroidota bacterium]|jgi:beta-lactamase class A